ncbi:aryl-alcohol dehydrogenase-like predicted oxidoreductase [Saccharothrix tamanrassetensis]|uniref:Aryl-alcohol dehydrogenase-like predicted oxidoreductase n=1 Tax=Saccharothrix tamanrassetensis TaxID=1051531 RepID=A0A841CUX3_9PSEU|nr:aldo/keto reductase [Saccharothrix tamanrassetensis]MBB5960114.1 aryl-alcohol dehydrogenase-like predicted oxidoreductase [Saccharothrix tamanrassetensis]
MTKPFPTRTLGRSGPEVSALGLGLMGMSDLYGPADEAEGIATVHAALDAGVTLLDTGDFYGMGHNELLLREALKGRTRDNAVVSVKFGALRDPDGGWSGHDNRPAAVKNFAAYSLKRLGTDHIDIYRPARLDPAVPIEDTVGAIAELVQAGHVRHIGLSEVGAGTLRRAQAVHPIADLQIEYSLISRGIEAEILPTARELGIGITAYGVLSRGLISGHWSQDRVLQGQDFRTMSPRFQGDNLHRNLSLVEALRTVATTKNATVAQTAIAWVAAQGDDIVPLVGARTRPRLTEALAAATLTLTPADLAAIEQAVPATAAAGSRYATPLMNDLDSER